MGVRIVGLVFALAGFLIYWGLRRARRKGLVGPPRRRIDRRAQPLRFKFALALRAAAALICFAAAYLCLTYGVHHLF